MDERISKFLANQPVGCLSVAMPEGSLHGSTLHFSHADDPFVIYFQTGKGTRKAQAFSGVASAEATMVVGVSDVEWVTLQLDGQARVLTSTEEIEACKKVHHAKHPQSVKHVGPTTIFIAFTPRWYRYTDFNTHPETELEVTV